MAFMALALLVMLFLPFAGIFLPPPAGRPAGKVYLVFLFLFLAFCTFPAIAGFEEWGRGRSLEGCLLVAIPFFLACGLLANTLWANGVARKLPEGMDPEERREAMRRLARRLWFPALFLSVLSASALLLPLRRFSGPPRSQVLGISNMKQLGLALMIYEDREGKFPPYDGDRFLAAVYVSKDCPDLHCFSPKGVAPPLESQVRAMTPGCLPGLAGYRNATSCMVDWSTPSVCAIACDTKPDGTSPYGGGHIRCVLYQDGSIRPQNDLTIGSTNGDPGGPKDLSMLQLK